MVILSFNICFNAIELTYLTQGNIRLASGKMSTSRHRLVITGIAYYIISTVTAASKRMLPMISITVSVAVYGSTVSTELTPLMTKLL